MEKWGWDANTAISSPLPTHDEPANHYMNKQFVNRNMTGGGSNYSAQLFDQYAENKRVQQEARQQAVAAQSRRSSHLSPQSANGQLQHKPSPQPRKMPPPGIVNPMFGNADFSGPKHPYQDYYVAPSQQIQQQGHMGLGLALTGMAQFSGAQHYQF